MGDTVDGTGDVLADCGPVESTSSDFADFWRVWDGENWREDRNITTEVILGDPPPPGINGLRVDSAPSCASIPTRQARASSQEPAVNRQPESRPPPSSARASSGRPAKNSVAYPAAVLTPRPPDSARSRFNGTEGLPPLPRASPRY